MDVIFRALADPNRRTLLEALAFEDGLTSGQLEAMLPIMTRFGVMKHLRVLEDANLVLTRRDGRFKYHYLNRAPIEQIARAWFAIFMKPLLIGGDESRPALAGGEAASILATPKIEHA